MSSPRKSLNIHVPWQRLLHVLGLESKSQALPALARCPLCDAGRLAILQDYVVGGQWHYCPACNLSGDMIQLASAAWDLSIKATLTKLRSLGFVFPEFRDRSATNKAILCYEQRRVKYQARFQALWRSASDGRVFRSKSSKLLHKMGLHLQDIPATYLPATVGQIVGAYEAMEIEGVFMPGSVANRTRSAGTKKKQLRKSNPSHSRIFRGRGWDNAIMLPFYDLPGRICAFMFTGRDCLPEDVSYRPLRLANRYGPREGGLAFHPDVLERRHKTIFALGDYLRALKMQVQHYRTSNDTLPVVIWNDAEACRTQRAWQIFRGRRIVFWASVLDVGVLHQAILANGHVCTIGSADGANHRLNENFSRYPAEQILRRMKAKAKPWPAAMNHLINNAADHEVEDMLRQLRLRGLELHGVLSRLSSNVAERAQALITAEGDDSRLVVDGRSVEERSGCWYQLTPKGEELISEASLRLDLVIHHKKSSRTFYKGRVIYRGEEIPFTEEKSKLEKQTLAWMQELVIHEGRGVPKFSPAWNARAVAIAQRLQPPKLVDGVDTVGWSERRSAFVFPGFNVRFGGKAKKDTATVALQDTPCQALQPPTKVFAAELSRLLDYRPANVAFWATWILATSNIIARALHKQTTGIAISGKYTAGPAKAAVLALDLRTYELPLPSSFQKLLNHEFEHGVPIAVQFNRAPHSRRARKYLELTDMPRNCLLLMDNYQAPMAAINNGWNCVWSDAEDALDPAAGDIGKQLLPHFLRYVCQRNLRDFHNRDRFAELTFDATASWLSHLDADPQVIREAKQLSGVADKSVILGRWLACMMSEGRINVAPRDYTEEENTIWRIPIKQRIFIPKRVLLNVAKLCNAARPDLLAVTKCLEEAGALDGEGRLNSVSGWFVREPWWNKMLHQHRAARTMRLKVHDG